MVGIIDCFTRIIVMKLFLQLPAITLLTQTAAQQLALADEKYHSGILVYFLATLSDKTFLLATKKIGLTCLCLRLEAAAKLSDYSPFSLHKVYPSRFLKKTRPKLSANKAV